MRKRIIYIIVMVFVVFFSLNNDIISAETISNVNEKIRKLEKEQSEIRGKTNEINKDKKEINEKMDANKSEQATVQGKLDSIEAELVVTRAEIQTVSANIASTEKELDELKSEIKLLNRDIKQLEKRIEERNILLKDRLRSIQENGGKSQFISVLLGAQSFTDFIMRTTAVNTIMDQDRSIMEEHEQDQIALEKKKTEVEAKKADVELKMAELEGQKSKLDALKVQLDDQKAEQAELKKELEVEYAEMEQYELSLEEEQQIMAAEAEAIKQLKVLAEKEKAELIEKQRQEEERQRQQQQNGNETVNNNTSPPAIQGNGLLLRPVPQAINSPYRPAHRPNHKGVDMAAPAGTPVVAAGAGIVTKVVTGCGVGPQWHRCGGGFGNVVYITHLINGRTITTVYAHLSSVNVSLNQTVSRGQTVGGVGNTGHSFGNHLHFEVHEGGFNGHSSARNPVSYF